MPSKKGNGVRYLSGHLGRHRALGAQIIANVFADRREDKRRAHEREVKRMELEDKKRERLREELLKAYVGFAEMTKTVNPSEPYELADLSGALSGIELLAGSEAVVEAANDLHGAAFRVRKKAREIELTGTNPLEDEAFSDLFNTAMKRRDSFCEFAREDLTR